MSDRSPVTRRSLLVGVAALTVGSLAHAATKAEPRPSVVGACSVTDCKFNENHECHAGTIEVRVGADGAVCGTYSPEGSNRPRP